MSCHLLNDFILPPPKTTPSALCLTSHCGSLSFASRDTSTVSRHAHYFEWEICLDDLVLMKMMPCGLARMSSRIIGSFIRSIQSFTIHFVNSSQKAAEEEKIITCSCSCTYSVFDSHHEKRRLKRFPFSILGEFYFFVASTI